LGDEIEEEIISSKREKLAERDETCWLDFCFLARSVTRIFRQNIFFGKYGIDFDKKKSKYRPS
jgi:hypothetical protein